MKNDPEFNIRFVKLVEKYPQLFNYTLECYANKQEVDRAWKEIALTLNETVVNVVAKWTTLRNNFNRSLRESAKLGADAENRKCYYLAQYMQFLVPFFKSRNNERREKKLENQETESSQDVQQFFKFENGERRETNQEAESSQDKQASVLSEEENYARESGYDTFHDEDAPLSSSVSMDRVKTKKFMSYAVEGNKKPRTEANRNPDDAFFQSLLPLVEKLNDSEKIRFRISCMQTLQRIVDGKAIPYNRTMRPVSGPNDNQHIEVECSDAPGDASVLNFKSEIEQDLE